MLAKAPYSPRIGIVGNMNNGGFAIMRYFRDLGADAYLLPYATDGRGELAHFAPEADTWHIQRWRPFIRPVPLANTTSALFSTGGVLFSPRQRRRVEESLSDYDVFVGSGLAPALFDALDRQLGIFFPYSTGVEFYGDIRFREQLTRFGPRSLVYAWLRRLQARGIRAARRCLNAEMSLTRESLQAIGKPFEPLCIPAVYNREEPPSTPPAHLAPALERLSAADIGLVSCARLLWVRDPAMSESDWLSFTKNSDWMFRGLAQFVARHPSVRAVLAVMEYGPDVEASKRLVASLGLQDHVIWLPKMPRRELMLLLSAADAVVGEFYQDRGVIWGGTGWEALAAGRPLIQSLNFTAREFERQFGHPPPDLMDVRVPEHFARHLAELHAHPDLARQRGRDNLAWFERHNGIGMARRWLQLLTATVH